MVRTSIRAQLSAGATAVKLTQDLRSRSVGRRSLGKKIAQENRTNDMAPRKAQRKAQARKSLARKAQPA
jgi:hypothetical protein